LVDAAEGTFAERLAELTADALKACPHDGRRTGPLGAAFRPGVRADRHTHRLTRFHNPVETATAGHGQPRRAIRVCPGLMPLRGPQLGCKDRLRASS
jgi:hypothetical protein